MNPREKFANQLFLFFLVLLFTSLFFSRALLSISMGGLFVSAMIQIKPKHIFNNLRQKQFAILYAIMFLMGLITYFYSEDKSMFSNYIRVWIPFVLLPISFFSMPSLSYKNFYYLLSYFVLLIVLSVFWCLYHFMQDPIAIIDSYEQAKVMPTPMKNDHIRYSLTVVIGACISVMLAMASSKKQMFFKNEQALFTAIAIFLFLFLHLLAVKSGLVAAWLCFAWLGVVFLYKRKYKLVLLLSCFVILTPILSFLFVPTFQQKLNYIKFEINEHQSSGRVEYLSDVNRIVSYQLAMNIINEFPLTGVGLGDINDVMMKSYAELYPDVHADSQILPHNQWLCNGLAMGYPGIIILCLVFIFPLTNKKFRTSFMGICLLIVNFMALMVEPVLMVQLGVCTFMIYTMLFFRHYSNKQSRDTQLVFGCELISS